MASYSTQTYKVTAKEREAAAKEGKTIRDVIREREAAQRPKKKSKKPSLATPAALEVMQAVYAGDPAKTQELKTTVTKTPVGSQITDGVTLAKTQDLSRPTAYLTPGAAQAYAIAAQDPTPEQQRELFDKDVNLVVITPGQRPGQSPTTGFKSMTPLKTTISTTSDTARSDVIAVEGYSDLTPAQQAAFRIRGESQAQARGSTRQYQAGQISAEQYTREIQLIQRQANREVRLYNIQQKKAYMKQYWTAYNKAEAETQGIMAIQRQAEQREPSFVEKAGAAAGDTYNFFNQAIKKYDPFYKAQETILRRGTEQAIGIRDFVVTEWNKSSYSTNAPTTWQGQTVTALGKTTSGALDITQGIQKSYTDDPYAITLTASAGSLIGGGVKIVANPVAAKLGTWLATKSKGTKILVSGVVKGTGAGLRVSYAGSVVSRGVTEAAQRGEKPGVGIGRVLGRETIPLYAGMAIGMHKFSTVKRQETATQWQSQDFKEIKTKQTSLQQYQYSSHPHTIVDYGGYKRLDYIDPNTGRMEHITVKRFYVPPAKSWAGLPSSPRFQQQGYITFNPNDVSSTSFKQSLGRGWGYNLPSSPRFQQQGYITFNPTQQTGIGFRNIFGNDQGTFSASQRATTTFKVIFTPKQGGGVGGLFSSKQGGGGLLPSIGSLSITREVTPVAAAVAQPSIITGSISSLSGITLGKVTPLGATAITGLGLGMIQQPQQKLGLQGMQKLNLPTMEKQLNYFSISTNLSNQGLYSAQAVKPPADQIKDTGLGIGLQQGQAQVQDLQINQVIQNITMPDIGAIAVPIGGVVVTGGIIASNFFRPGGIDYGRGGGVYSRKRRSKKPSRKYTKYTPSLTSIGLGIKGEKTKGVYFGLSNRPMIGRMKFGGRGLI